MNTYCAFTFGASPFYILVLYKFPDTVIPDIFKVFDHAHIVFGPVSRIKMFQITAGEISAFKTKFCAVFLKCFAGLNFTSNTCDRFIYVRSSAAWTFVFHPQMTPANTTVYTARSYQSRFIQRFHGYLFNSYGVGI
jgi:hypothetical protein